MGPASRIVANWFLFLDETLAERDTILLATAGGVLARSLRMAGRSSEDRLILRVMGSERWACAIFIASLQFVCTGGARCGPSRA